MGRLRLHEREAVRALWRGHFEAWRLSELTQREYCERFVLGQDRVVPVHEAPGARPLRLAGNERAWSVGCSHGSAAVNAAGRARLAPARAGVAACRRWLK